MAETLENLDFIDEQRRELEEAETRLRRVLAKAHRCEGDEVAAHDKELQDARDLLRLAQRAGNQLESASDEELGRDRRGFQHVMHELGQVLEGVEARLDSDESGKAPDAQRHHAPRV